MRRATTFQFELERRPLVAVVSYEMLGATVGAPPTISVNGQPQGDSEVRLPDLSDPGYRGESEEGRSQDGFPLHGLGTRAKGHSGRTRWRRD